MGKEIYIYLVSFAFFSYLTCILHLSLLQQIAIANSTYKQLNKQCQFKKWESPTWMLDVGDEKLHGAGSKLKQTIWEVARHELQQWTKEELTPTSLYGIRKYTEGAILATHVDRLPLVISAIINVAQDVDEPWPLEVYGHDGIAYNVTMEPGESE